MVLVGSSTEGEGRVDSTVLYHNIPKSRRIQNIFLHLDCLGHTIDVTDTFFRRSVRMVFALGYNDMLNVISKQKEVKIVAADFTVEIPGHSTVREVGKKQIVLKFYSKA